MLTNDVLKGTTPMSSYEQITYDVADGIATLYRVLQTDGSRYKSPGSHAYCFGGK
jgi:hypothetical protein